MDYKFLHFAVISCIFLVVGFILLRSYQKSKAVHQETMTVGTITGYGTNNNGRIELYADIQIAGQTVKHYPFLLKAKPAEAGVGSEIQISYYLDEKDRPQCTIRSAGFEALPPTNPVFAYATLAVGAVFLILSLVFIIKNIIKS